MEEGIGASGKKEQEIGQDTDGFAVGKGTWRRDLKPLICCSFWGIVLLRTDKTPQKFESYSTFYLFHGPVERSSWIGEAKLIPCDCGTLEERPNFYEIDVIIA